MKSKVKTLAICALVIGAFCFGKSLTPGEKKMFEFPELNAAKRDLLSGRGHLDKASRDFGGHRAKAVEHLDKAVKEIDEAILYGDKP
jgi:hypothetical protein